MGLVMVVYDVNNDFSCIDECLGVMFGCVGAC
jgi:hypothetical protein